MAQNDVYTKKQIAEVLAGIVDIQEREIGYWTDLGIVTPSIANPGGRGYTRYYSLPNVVDFAIAKMLVNSGLNLKAVRLAVAKLRENHRITYYTTFLGRQIIVIKNPNDEHVAVDVVGKANPISKIEVDLSEAGSWFVMDITATIEAVMALGR
jgi:DNA-binding transcriptional MerR regulator